MIVNLGLRALRTYVLRLQKSPLALSPPDASTLVAPLAWLRPFTALGQAIAVGAVIGGLHVALPLAPLAAGIAALAIASMLAFWRMRQAWPVGEIEAVGHLAFDLLLLGWALYFTGGASNPFITLLLVPVALSAAALSLRGTAAVVLLAGAVYAVLMFRFVPLADMPMHDATGFRLHLTGMAINFGIAVLLLAVFMGRMTRSLQVQREATRRLRERILRDEGILAVATQAAEAAHELNTPLSTLRTLLPELQRGREHDVELGNDVRLMLGEVERCRTILRNSQLRLNDPHLIEPAMSRLTPFFVCMSVVLALPAYAGPAPSPLQSPQSSASVDGASRAAAAPQIATSDRASESARARHADDDHPNMVTLGTIDVPAYPLAVELDASRRRVPGDVTVLNGEGFYRRAVGNLADALRYVPGVMAQSNTGGDDGVISIRGSNLTALSYANSGVALFQDGLPVATADGSNHNRLLDPAAARYVIVANGANALGYGASVLGGAIDFITPTARNSDPRQLYLYGGSDGLVEGRFSTGGVAGAFDGMLSVGGKHFDGYQQHSRENRVNLRGNAGWQVSDDFNLRVFATYINNRQQLAGSLTRAEFDADPRLADPSCALGNHQVNVETARMAATGSWAINAQSGLEFGVSYETQSLYHPIVDVYDFRFDPPPDYFSLLIDTAQHNAGGMLRYHLKTGNHDLLAGINLAHTINEGANFQNNQGQRGAMTDDIDQRAGNITLFALDHWNFSARWTLVYGAQAVSTDRDLRDTSLAYGSVRHQQATYSSINPRLGMLYQLGHDSEAFASVSRVYQPPSNFDLDNDVAKDDSTLDAMQGMSYEVGARGNTGTPSAGGSSWRWSVALYYAAIRNEILSVEDPSQPGTMLSTNYDHTIHAGLEAKLGASFPVVGTTQFIEPRVSISWNDFTFDHDPVFGNNRLPSAPDFAVHGEVMYRNTKTGFYAGPTFDWSGSRYADMANSYHVDGYFLLGLRAGIQRAGWNLFAEARNLADTHYVNAVSVRTQAGPDARVLNAGAPRSVFVGLRVSY